MKKVPGGLLVQNYNSELLNMDDLKVVTEKKPTQEELEDLIFAMKVVKHTKSNGYCAGKGQADY